MEISEFFLQQNSRLFRIYFLQKFSVITNKFPYNIGKSSGFWQIFFIIMEIKCYFTEKRRNIPEILMLLASPWSRMVPPLSVRTDPSWSNQICYVKRAVIGRLQGHFSCKQIICLKSRQQIVPLYISLVPISFCVDICFILLQKRYKKKKGYKYPWQSVALKEVRKQTQWWDLC